MSVNQVDRLQTGWPSQVGTHKLLPTQIINCQIFDYLSFEVWNKISSEKYKGFFYVPV